MSKLGYGRIEELHVLRGEPDFDPPPRVYRDIRLGGESRPRYEPKSSSHELKSVVRDLFLELDQIDDGLVEWIEVRDGLPARIRIRDSSTE